MFQPGNISRREVLRIGCVSLFGSAVGRASLAGTAERPAASHNGRSCIFMLLQGGPSHLDLWDPKPEAPAEVRGGYAPIDTNVPGIRFTTMLPETARVADKLAVVRSVTHAFNNHIAGTYITLTGSADQPNQDREAKGDDFPGPGAVLNYLQRVPTAVPPAISLPTWLSIPGPSNRMPGQYGGFLGGVHDPFLISGDPEQEDFRPLSLTLPDGCDAGRMSGRWSLLGEMDAAACAIDRRETQTYDRLHSCAYELLTDPRVREAVDLSREPDSVRERYGKTKIGQSLLLSRRLVEAGVRLVGYNAFNQEWDTHQNIPGRYSQIMPGMDRAYSALISDLAERGVLDTTLVINAGEFGRTPLINQDGGRDHWPDVYTVALAGGGIRGGQVYGSSDKKGAFVGSDPVSPADLLATMWQILGINPATELRDRLNRPLVLSRGRVLSELL
ncbi:MAG: DUF1501 domain-containing protein [Pirellulales bacterium]|nr:DUF1501 domain-containing protein [Pirellulales bacterium]